MEYIVEIEGIKKYYQVTKRNRSGMWRTIKSLFKREYHRVKALDGIDLKIKQGEIRAIIGPNGAGKSTVLKILSGILYPTQGHAVVMGMVPWEERKRLVKNLGVVFGQKSKLWWDLPAVDSFWLHKMIYDIPEEVYEKNLAYFKEHLNLQEVVGKPVRQLSLGERMKCEFVCAMLHEPSLVILDEPTIGLDVFSKEEIRNFIRNMNEQRGTTFIITTHDLNDVEELCENITVINRGKVNFDDSMEHLQTYYRHRKILELQFERKVEEEALEEYSIIEFQGLSAKIEVDLRKKELKEVIGRIWETLPLMDFNVKNISIEEVIKDIY